jgi:hypothetical protein
VERSREDSSVEALIEEQRRLARSCNHFEQVIGTLFVAGVLKRKLAGLPNEALGHLMFEFVSDELGVFSPELTICQAATERLLNSSPLLVKNSKENPSK